MHGLLNLFPNFRCNLDGSSLSFDDRNLHSLAYGIWLINSHSHPLRHNVDHSFAAFTVTAR